MWIWLLSNIAGCIVGDAVATWFEKTALGRWFYKKLDNICNWAAKRYGIEILKSEDKWRQKYPNIAIQLKILEERVKLLERDK